MCLLFTSIAIMTFIVIHTRMCLLFTSIAIMTSIVIHTRMGHIYWINSLENCIKRANMNGTNITAVVSGDISNPGQCSIIYHVSESYGIDKYIAKWRVVIVRLVNWREHIGKQQKQLCKIPPAKYHQQLTCFCININHAEFSMMQVW